MHCGRRYAQAAHKLFFTPSQIVPCELSVAVIEAYAVPECQSCGAAADVEPVADDINHASSLFIFSFLVVVADVAAATAAGRNASSCNVGVFVNSLTLRLLSRAHSFVVKERDKSLNGNGLSELGSFVVPKALAVNHLLGCLVVK
eukprot:6480793-Amphidinium_carterae.1